MKCGFFCDTGFIRGLSDKLDVHNESCEFFFSKYPLDDFEYAISKMVVNELNYYKYKLSKEANHRPMEKIYFSYVRLVQQYIDLYLSQMEHFECSESDMDDLNHLIVVIQPIIGFDTRNKQNDIQITADGIVWSNNSENDFNSLLTVDKKDIFEKRKKIIAQSKKINNSLNINFVYLPLYYKVKSNL